MPLSFSRIKVLDGIQRHRCLQGTRPWSHISLRQKSAIQSLSMRLDKMSERRQLDFKSARAVIAEQFANLKQGSNRYRQK